MTDLQTTLDAIRSEFAALDADAKWAYLLRLARSHPAMDPSLKEEKFLVKGCATRLYLVPQFDAAQGLLHLHADTDGGSDSPLIVRGLAALVTRVYSGRSPAEIGTVPKEFFQDIGLTVALSATRANGFGSMLKQLYMYAAVYARMAGPQGG